jgi:NADH:ubiquinone oxidoreductase subunit 5 (subunit L)/multisubunit Na+/H+ antiporter MnhA subunit
MSLLLLLALPFIGSAVAAALPTNARNLESAWAAGVAAVVAVSLALHYPQVSGGGGRKSLAEGQQVQFKVVQGQKGLQAANIRPL